MYKEVLVIVYIVQLILPNNIIKIIRLSISVFLMTFFTNLYSYINT